MARTPEASTGSTPEPTPTKDSKGRPTPTRREKEEARKRPLVVNDRAERRRREREAANIQRERARIGMANGDERYLPTRDRGPQRRFIRDYVDARWSVGELLLPTIVVFFITSFFPYDIVVFTGFGLMWFILIASLIDIVLASYAIKRRLEEKFGAADKGFRFYIGMRAIYFRQMRQPKPQVKRGDFPA